MVESSFPPGSPLPKHFLYHNTSALEDIKREGLSAGSFSDFPIAFGHKYWIAVSNGDLPPLSVHKYGDSTAYEPAWVEGYDEKGFPRHHTVPASKIYQVDPLGRVIKRLR